MGSLPVSGMPALIELPDWPACLVLCRRLGLSFVELNLNLPQYQVERLRVDELRRAAENGVGVTFHVDENFNPADFNPRLAAAHRDTFARVLDLAQEVGAPVITMHMAEGVHFTLPDQKVYLYERYRDEYRAGLSVLRDVAEAHAGGGVKVGVENCGGFKPHVREGVEFLLESPVFGLTFDVGHDHTAGGADAAFLVGLRDRIVHMHLHDARGGSADRPRANHLALGDGEVDVRSMLSLAARHNWRCVLETKTVDALERSVHYAHDQSASRVGKNP